MNKERRKKIRDVLREIESLKDVIEKVRDEEMDSYDNLPDGFKCGEKGEEMEEHIDNLDEAIYSIINVEEHLEEVL